MFLRNQLRLCEGHEPRFGSLVGFSGLGPRVLHRQLGLPTAPLPRGAHSEEKVDREAWGTASEWAPEGGGGVGNPRCPRKTCEPCPPSHTEMPNCSSCPSQFIRKIYNRLPSNLRSFIRRTKLHFFYRYLFTYLLTHSLIYLLCVIFLCHPLTTNYLVCS